MVPFLHALKIFSSSFLLYKKMCFQFENTFSVAILFSIDSFAPFMLLFAGGFL